jgi:hypothetical protein
MVSSGWSSPRSQLLIACWLRVFAPVLSGICFANAIAINQQLPARFAVLVYLSTLEFVSFWAYHSKFTSKVVDKSRNYN